MPMKSEELQQNKRKKALTHRKQQNKRL